MQYIRNIGFLITHRRWGSPEAGFHIARERTPALEPLGPRAPAARSEDPEWRRTQAVPSTCGSFR